MKWVLLLFVLAACSSSPSDPAIDAGLPDAVPASHGELVLPFSGVPAGALVPVLFHASSPVDLDDPVISLHRGHGSLARRFQQDTEIAAHGELAFVRVVAVPVRELSGVLSGEDLQWTGAEIHLVGDASVPAGSTLILDGARVLAGPNVDLVVEGRLEAHASLFTSTSTWGGLRLAPGATAELETSWFLAGGDDPAQAFGHSGSQPVIFVDSGAELTMTGGGVLDSPGKAFGSRAARVTLDGVMIARCDTGGEHDGSTVIVKNAHISEIPDADGLLDDDDNDGIYLRLGDASIERSVFAVGEDDAIDHNGADLRVRGLWIRRFAHEGVATSTGGTVELVDATISACSAGVEAGYGAPQVSVVHSTIRGNAIGVRFGDDYDMPCTGHIDIDHSIVEGNQEDVRNFVIATGAPLEGAVEVHCSDIGGVPTRDRDCQPPFGARP